MDCSNAFKSVGKMTVLLVEEATCLPALTPFVAECYHDRPVDVFLQMHSRECRTIACSRGGTARGPYGAGDVLFVVETGTGAFSCGVHREEV